MCVRMVTVNAPVCVCMCVFVSCFNILMGFLTWMHIDLQGLMSQWVKAWFRVQVIVKGLCIMSMRVPTGTVKQTFVCMCVRMAASLPRYSTHNRQRMTDLAFSGREPHIQLHTHTCAATDISRW